MPRIKSTAYRINHYKEKRYMSGIFDAVSEPNTPRTPPSPASTVVDSIDATSTPLAPRARRRLFQLQNQFITMDICGVYVDLLNICALLKSLPCMNNINIQIDLYQLMEYPLEDSPTATKHGRMVLCTRFNTASPELFIIQQILGSKDITEEYTVDIPNDEYQTMRAFWCQ